MACGCKNCNGAVSLTGQLPPGCDSILNISTEIVNGDVLVTITFCSGAIQQFTVPSGQSGTNGENGADGAQGPAGTGISNVEVSQEGNEVTLTITLDNGDIYNETFVIQSAPSAYVVDSQHFDTVPQLTLNNTEGLTILASSIIPGNTVITNGDTILFDSVFRLSVTGDDSVPTAIFKQLYLSLGPLGGTVDAGELCSNLSFPNFNSTIRQFRIQGQMTKIESSGLGTNAMNIIGTLSLWDKADSTTISNGITGDPINTMPALRYDYGFYSASAQGLSFSSTLQFQVLGTKATYSPGVTVNLDTIYFVTTKIPKL